MSYLVIGRDGHDAAERRQAQRQAHLDSVAKLKSEGKILYAVAMLEEGKMVGSVMVFDFESVEELEVWKANEPYITGNVWETVEVMECAVPPAFK
ncbi:YciI family protein [Marinoscillum sp. MHG1-6]|uniref:YciI family protein n=1 Tax=Marinoscillum sp. MHG1-6 TaxID=2959627 RepID=UPI0021584935|nr:YciI family protein [Marinoscillum sp. MHG1-6]